MQLIFCKKQKIEITKPFAILSSNGICANSLDVRILLSRRRRRMKKRVIVILSLKRWRDSLNVGDNLEMENCVTVGKESGACVCVHACACGCVAHPVLLTSMKMLYFLCAFHKKPDRVRFNSRSLEFRFSLWKNTTLQNFMNSSALKVIMCRMRNPHQNVARARARSHIFEHVQLRLSQL